MSEVCAFEVYMCFPVGRELKHEGKCYWNSSLQRVYMCFPVGRELKLNKVDGSIGIVSIVYMCFPVGRELKLSCNFNFQGHLFLLVYMCFPVGRELKRSRRSWMSAWSFCLHVLSRW